MDPWIGLLGLVVVLAGTWMVAAHRRYRPSVVLRIDGGQDPDVPLTIVNAGRDAVFALEATLRFEPHASRSGHVLERHRRTRVLLPGERLAFPLPEDTGVGEAARLATLARRVHLDAVGRDAAGREVTARDVLDDPVAWIGSGRLPGASADASRPGGRRPTLTHAP